MKLTCIGFSLALLLPARVLASQKVLKDKHGSPFNEGFGQFAIDTLLEWYVPGLAIAVVDGDNSWAAVSLGSCLSCFVSDGKHARNPKLRCQLRERLGR
jgi:hypothetical protein